MLRGLNGAAEGILQEVPAMIVMTTMYPAMVASKIRLIEVCVVSWLKGSPDGILNATD